MFRLFKHEYQIYMEFNYDLCHMRDFKKQNRKKWGQALQCNMPGKVAAGSFRMEGEGAVFHRIVEKPPSFCIGFIREWRSERTLGSDRRLSTVRYSA